MLEKKTTKQICNKLDVYNEEYETIEIPEDHETIILTKLYNYENKFWVSQESLIKLLNDFKEKVINTTEGNYKYQMIMMFDDLFNVLKGEKE